MRGKGLAWTRAEGLTWTRGEGPLQHFLPLLFFCRTQAVTEILWAGSGISPSACLERKRKSRRSENRSHRATPEQAPLNMCSARMSMVSLCWVVLEPLLCHCPSSHGH